jgi:hypothetical protein
MRCVFVVDIRQTRSSCELNVTVSGWNASRGLRSSFVIAREESVQLSEGPWGRG